MGLIPVEQGGTDKGKERGSTRERNVAEGGVRESEDGIAHVFVGHEERHGTSCSAVEGALCLELNRSKRPTTLLSIAKVSAISAP